jgi:hypothetical protein
MAGCISTCKPVTTANSGKSFSKTQLKIIGHFNVALSIKNSEKAVLAQPLYLLMHISLTQKQ